MISVLLPTTVPLHGILCHSHSDISRNLIASSELWKLFCFLSINELHTNVVFFYFQLPTINTTLVINKARHFLTIDINVIIMFFGLCFAYGLWGTMLCALLNWVKICYLIYFTMFILFFYVLGLFYYVSPLCICIVIVTCSIKCPS